MPSDLESGIETGRVWEFCPCSVGVRLQTASCVKTFLTLGTLALALVFRAQLTLPLLLQSLIMVFAHLVHSQLEPLLEFLCSLPGPTGKPALEFVMAEWMSRQHLFYGQYEGKVR